MPAVAKNRIKSADRVNKDGILFFKGDRMKHLKHRNSITQLAKEVQLYIDETAVNCAIEVIAAAAGVMAMDPSRKTLSRKDITMVKKDMMLSTLSEDLRARNIKISKVGSKRHR